MNMLMLIITSDTAMNGDVGEESLTMSVRGEWPQLDRETVRSQPVPVSGERGEVSVTREQSGNSQAGQHLY